MFFLHLNISEEKSLNWIQSANNHSYPYYNFNYFTGLGFFLAD